MQRLRVAQQEHHNAQTNHPHLRHQPPPGQLGSRLEGFVRQRLLGPMDVMRYEASYNLITLSRLAQATTPATL